MTVTFEKTELQTLLNDVHNWHAKKLTFLIQNVDWTMMVRSDPFATASSVADRLRAASERFVKENPEPKWTDYLK